jgi:hypothetical protein
VLHQIRLVVRPATVLRWHRDLIAARHAWSHQHSHASSRIGLHRYDGPGRLTWRKIHDDSKQIAVTRADVIFGTHTDTSALKSKDARLASTVD